MYDKMRGKRDNTALCAAYAMYMLFLTIQNVFPAVAKHTNNNYSTSETLCHLFGTLNTIVVTGFAYVRR